MKKISFECYDGAKLSCYLFDDVEKKAGVVQIVHGMQEHAKRYADFAKFLNKHGFVVFVSDLRGHGESAEDANYLGYTTGDITKDNILDQIAIAEHLKQQYPALPLTILGHSYGSFILQHIITQTDIANKVVLSGSAYSNTMLMKFANLVARITLVFKGKKARAKLIEKLSFKNYAKSFDDGNWLSRDPEVWKKYNDDKLCGTPFPASFYKSMMSTITKNYRDIEEVNKQTPILLIGGQLDPVSENGKLLIKLNDFYKKHGLNVQLKLYEDARHEVLNETNKLEVYGDIVDFLKK